MDRGYVGSHQVLRDSRIDPHPKQMGRVRARTEAGDQKAKPRRGRAIKRTLSEIDGPFVLVEEYGEEF